jgi:hypothetical protein
VLENRVLRELFEPKREELTGGEGDCIMRSFMMCTADQI